jgi:hypothetical protein
LLVHATLQLTQIAKTIAKPLAWPERQQPGEPTNASRVACPGGAQNASTYYHTERQPCY